MDNLKISKKSAFNPWIKSITFSEIIILLDNYHKLELDLLEKKIQIQILDNQVIIYKRKKIKEI